MDSKPAVEHAAQAGGTEPGRGLREVLQGLLESTVGLQIVRDGWVEWAMFPLTLHTGMKVKLFLCMTYCWFPLRRDWYVLYAEMYSFALHSRVKAQESSAVVGRKENIGWAAEVSLNGIPNSNAICLEDFDEANRGLGGVHGLVSTICLTYLYSSVVSFLPCRCLTTWSPWGKL